MSKRDDTQFKCVSDCIKNQPINTSHMPDHIITWYGAYCEISLIYLFSAKSTIAQKASSIEISSHRCTQHSCLSNFAVLAISA